MGVTDISFIVSPDLDEREYKLIRIIPESVVLYGKRTALLIITGLSPRDLDDLISGRYHAVSGWSLFDDSDT